MAVGDPNDFCLVHYMCTPTVNGGIGLLTIITGPMFSGKTTELLRLYDRKVIGDVPCLLVKYCGDTRYSSDEIMSHRTTGGHGVQAPAMSAGTISEIMDHIDGPCAAVFIDEIQFFPDKGVILDILDLGIDVFVSGLNGDWQRKMFPGMSELFSAACNITMLQAVCGFCKADNACYTVRTTSENEDIVIGGADKYKAACPKCQALNRGLGSTKKFDDPG